MTPPRSVALIVCALLAVVLSGCAGQSGGSTALPTTSPRATSTSTPASTPATQPTAEGTQQEVATEPPRAATIYGMAGLIPPHYPNSSNEDYLAFYNGLKELGGWVGTYAGWTRAAGVPEVATTQRQVGDQIGFRTLPIIGFHADTQPGVRMNVDFTDAQETQRFADDLAQFAADTETPYLGIGNEVNRVWEEDPAAFDAWVAALPGIVRTIHAAAPNTQVFVTFQYEFLRGGGAISGQTRQPEWHLLDRVSPYLDLVAFTTYPYFDYGSPADLPDDYYLEGARRAGKPVAFSEVGWPSRRIAPLGDSPLGGTPEEQAAFVERLGDLMRDVRPVFLMWVWPYDTDAIGATFDSLALSEANGTPKPALAAWKALIGR